jgi:hypothetical protein
VLRGLGYRSKGPGSIPGATRLSDGSGTGSLSFVCTFEELLERESSGSGLENQDYGRRGSVTLTTRHPYLFQKVGTNFAEKRSRSIGHMSVS